ncbi:hypothetical protein Q5O14_17150 [Eubacteriaceae bacterium ES2]|nr:hypothetical protein Q5O14_17150 [Eubacteriaceae bacterium ES2]
MQVSAASYVSQFKRLSTREKIAGLQLPDFTDVHVYTKTESGISDSQYEKAIIEQAIKDQAAGKFQNESAGFNLLAKKYVSEVSPDRQSLITDGLTKVTKELPDCLKSIDWIALIFDGEIKYQQEAGNLEYAEFYDGNGEMVATFSNHGWTMFGTKAETQRQMAMCSIYNKAWGQAARQSESGSQSVKQQSFDQLV